MWRNVGKNMNLNTNQSIFDILFTSANTGNKREEKLMKFSMDFLMGGYFDEYNNISFEGIDLGYKWNGWACPAFTKEVADDIMTTINKVMGCMEFIDAPNGGYYVSYEDGIEYDRFEAMVIEGVVYYPIGAYSWVWEIVS